MSEVAKKYTNVAEARPLYDTVLVSPFHTSPHDVEGWFTSFALMGAQTEHYFFAVRNRSVGIAYNNQDKRDALPYGMRMHSFGVSFFAPSIRSLWGSVDQGAVAYEDNLSCDLWEKELPQHASVEFVVMQDEHIACNPLLCPPGYGMVGGGVGRGMPLIVDDSPTSIPTIKGSINQGVPEMNNRWPFPSELKVPRDGNLYAKIQFNTYARELLQQLPGPGFIASANEDGDDFQVIKPCFGIQVSIWGEALIQQRGQYHR